MKTALTALWLTMLMVVPTWAAEDFTGTKEVRLIHGDLGSPKAKTVVITDKAKIEKLVATIKLEKKVPCACDHIQHAVFVTAAGEITVSLCDHCFDVGKATYRMPPEFYKLYMAYWQEASARQPSDSHQRGEGGKAVAQPAYTSYYTGQITAIGKGTLNLHVLRGHSGIIHPVNVDKKTVVVLLDGKAGELSDLKVGQWIKVYWNLEPSDPKQQRIVKIEPGMPWWAAQRLADLEKNVGAVEISLMVFIGQIEQDGVTIRYSGPGDLEELHLVGPDHPGGYKEPFQARLQSDEMAKLLRHLAFEGFLAGAMDNGQKDATLKPPATPYLKLSVGKFYAYLAWGPDTIKRLKGMKAVVREPAARKIEGLLGTVEKQIAAVQKPMDEKRAATAEVVVRGMLESDAAGSGKGGWPTYTLTVSQVFKTPKDVKIEVGQKLTVKTIKEFSGPVTLYLVFDKDQKFYRLQDPYGERGFSHVEPGKPTMGGR